MPREEKLPTHSKCPHCKHEMRMPPYVYAHWTLELVATCEQCRQKYIVCEGKVIE